MGKNRIPKEKKEKIKEAVARFYPSLSLRQIARAFGVSVETVRKIKNSLIDTSRRSSGLSDRDRRKKD